MSRETERTWLAAMRRGESAAWGELYDVYAPLLYRRVLMPRLADATAAEDALSDTFQTAIERFDQYEERQVSFYYWLARIAHNKAMDMHRARSMSGRKIHDLTRMLEPLMGSAPGADDLLELTHDAAVVQRQIHRALDSLNPRYGRALELRFFQEKSREQCAELFQVKVGTFDVLLSRAVRAFEKAWRARSTELPAQRKRAAQ